VNREFLDWLSRRPQPQRPFFAFLNFYDAHHPYQLPPTGLRRFAAGGDDALEPERDPIRDWSLLARRGFPQQEIASLRNAYDDCVAGLDEHLGRLLDELERRALRERTWVILTADHGESFGEHPGVFRHGTSLYQTEVHVPLVILPPAGGPSPRVVAEPVSLRDLAETIVDVLGLQAGAPFPGASLARFWNHQTAPAVSDPSAAAGVLAEVVPLDGLNPDPSQLLQPRWPLAGLTEGGWTYLRREGTVREELYDMRTDARQVQDLAGNPAMRTILERMRETLNRLTAGPLTPQRFNP
jgi:arylsulfatase A-like enzyme